jgi:hypothetical protein
MNLMKKLIFARFFQRGSVLYYFYKDFFITVSLIDCRKGNEMKIAAWWNDQVCLLKNK